jgi:hypothetical protein
VITWSSGDRLLTAGPVKVYNEERLVHKHNGSQITLRYSKDSPTRLLYIYNEERLVHKHNGSQITLRYKETVPRDSYTDESCYIRTMGARSHSGIQGTVQRDC